MSDLKLGKIDIDINSQPGISKQEYLELNSRDQLRIMVISDTHRGTAAAVAALRRCPEIDLILHAGDHAADYTRLREVLRKPMIVVRGNCDENSYLSLPEIVWLNLAGFRIMMTHGNTRKFDVKQGLNKLISYVSMTENSADIVIYGHTHSMKFQEISIGSNICRLINPGSCSIDSNAYEISLKQGQPASFRKIVEDV